MADVELRQNYCLRQAIERRGPERLPRGTEGRDLMPDDRSNATMATHTGPGPATRAAGTARGAPHPEPAPVGGRWRRVARELGLLAVFAIIYEEIAAHLVQAGSVAASHALLVVGAERSLGVFDERAVQAVFVHNGTITAAF